ncbi:hypothetical protein [Peribacillus butanolivorans]
MYEAEISIGLQQIRVTARLKRCGSIEASAGIILESVDEKITTFFSYRFKAEVGGKVVMFGQLMPGAYLAGY